MRPPCLPLLGVLVAAALPMAEPLRADPAGAAGASTHPPAEPGAASQFPQKGQLPGKGKKKKGGGKGKKKGKGGGLLDGFVPDPPLGQPVTRPPAPPAPVLALPVPPDLAQEPRPGHRFLPAVDRLGADEVVHTDRHGGAAQALEDMVAGSWGFGAVWRDERIGSSGLYVGLLDADAEQLPVQRPVHGPITVRELEPSLAAGPNGLGAAVWFSQNEQRAQSNLRLFSVADAVFGPPVPLGAAVGELAKKTPQGEGLDGPSREPDVGFDGEGGGWAVWREGERILGQAFAPGPKPIGKPAVVGVGATGGPRIAMVGQSRLIAWPTARGISVKAGEGEVQVGAGELVAVEPDLVGPGWWLLVRKGARCAIRHLAPNGEPDRPDVQPADVPLVDFDFGTWRGLLLVVTEELQGGDERTEHGPIRLWLLDRFGNPLMAPLPLPEGAGRRATGPRIAVWRDTVVVGWTDRREGDASIYYRVFRPGELDRTDERWNNDQVSADQQHVALGSAGGERAWAAWVDERDGTPRVRVRRFVRRQGWKDQDRQASDESPYDPDLRETLPALAVTDDGRCLVAWIESVGDLHAVRARWFRPDGEPGGPVFALDGTAGAHPSGGPSLAWSPRTERCLVAWVRASGAVAAAVLSDEYATETKPFALSRPASARPVEYLLPHEREGVAAQLSLCALEDGGFVAAWTHTPEDPAVVQLPAKQALAMKGELAGIMKPVPGQPDRVELARPASVLAGRLVSAAGEIVSPVLPLPVSLYGAGDLEPTVAPTGEGGFVLAWTANRGPRRDVYAQNFDARAEPIGKPTFVTTMRNAQRGARLVALDDGSLACIWQDDLPGAEQVLVRRVTTRATRLDLGAVRLVHELDTSFSPHRTAPAACALVDGLLVAWDDRRRSKGHDVFAAAFGPRFDRRERAKQAAPVAEQGE